MNNNIPRPEYPRPDFERSEWLNLNGEWEFGFDDENIGEMEEWYLGKELPQHIIVPFCYQSQMSGIDDQGMHEIMWYKRDFHLPQTFRGKRVLLNFGAVDYEAKAWINGKYVGCHRGGHASFKMEVTRFLQDGDNTLVIRAEDRYDAVQPRGKQYWKEHPDRCWYTATSGIWQTVWLEATGTIYIDKIRMTPDVDKGTVGVELFLDQEPEDMEMEVTVRYQGVYRVKRLLTREEANKADLKRSSRRIKFDVNKRIMKATLDIQYIDDIDNIHYWSPESPNLYDIEFRLIKDGNPVDMVKSYFGMRKISIRGDLVFLNNRPYYQKLVLDQGYWPDSLLTPPSDEAIIYDLEMTKKMGFNGARKHQKIEDPRYYYWADRLGVLVWGEMPSPYHYNIEEIENVTREWKEFINRDYNHPSIVTWVPLNESWGVREIMNDVEQQNFARALYYLTKAMDCTRLVSTNDGWEMVEETDLCAIHDYAAWGETLAPKYQNLDKLLQGSTGGKTLYANGVQYKGQPVLITEYGGIAFDTGNEENWGYHGTVSDEEAFFARYASVTKALKNIPYVRGYCYTQLTDVMQEVNGLLTADRKPKVDLDRVREINN